MPKSLNYLQIITLFITCIPGLFLIWQATSDQLGANPIQSATQITGKLAIIFLLTTLTCTPISRLLKMKSFLTIRVILGLASFFYAFCHLFIFIVLDYGVNLHLLFLEVTNRPFILWGSFSFLILLPLAITTFPPIKKKIESTWKSVQRLIYLAGIVAVVHYFLAVKADFRFPLVSGMILFILLACRLPFISKILEKTPIDLSKLDSFLLI